MGVRLWLTDKVIMNMPGRLGGGLGLSWWVPGRFTGKVTRQNKIAGKFGRVPGKFGGVPGKFGGNAG
jgi:hypothetical protein